MNNNLTFTPTTEEVIDGDPLTVAKNTGNSDVLRQLYHAHKENPRTRGIAVNAVINSACPPDVIDNIIASSNNFMKRALMLHEGTLHDDVINYLFTNLESISKGSTTSTYISMAKRIELTEDMYLTISKVRDTIYHLIHNEKAVSFSSVLIALAKADQYSYYLADTPGITTEAILELIPVAKQDKKVLSLIGSLVGESHPCITPDLIRTMANELGSRLDKINFNLSEYRELPLEVIQLFANSNDKDSRCYAVSHPNVTDEIVTQLCSDEDEEVLSLVANIIKDKAKIIEFCSFTPKELKSKFNSNGHMVSINAAFNPNCPIDESLSVIKRVISKRYQQPWLYQHRLTRSIEIGRFYKYETLEIEDVPSLDLNEEAKWRSGALEILSNSSRYKDRVVAARYSDSPEIIGRLATDKVIKVRCALLENTNTSSDLMITIFNEMMASNNSKNQLLSNENTPAYMLLTVLKEGTSNEKLKVLEHPKMQWIHDVLNANIPTN